ncbi:hypothetical protein NUU61_004309 [Penicillium alfredii]|uniref:Uncharacterized protein n=1 Tax=Penicillium alfredii TaxID=1506179 RepID=A0A9W9FKZ2_9EURO|nr:uncharacterized protein NUU61_004309 [Penicillium alfredii]KAJ5102087.1 hypothetical protein NUU61_004309 [Penicillium alfredii]
MPQKPSDLLIARDKRLLNSHIRNGVAMQQYISMYTSWPSGLASLLKAGFEKSRQAFEWAGAADCVESVQLLLATKGSFLGEDAMVQVGFNSDPHIMELRKL